MVWQRRMISPGEMWRGKEMEQFVFENEKKKYIKDWDMLSLLRDKVGMLTCEGRVPCIVCLTQKNAYCTVVHCL